MSYLPNQRKVGIFYICWILFILVGFNLPVMAQNSSDSTMDLGATLNSFSKLSAGDKSMILGATGLPQVNDFNLAKIMAYFIFGAIGFVAFMYGKSNAAWRPMLIGAALTAYPYFFSGTLSIYLVGILLTAILYFWRE